MAEATMAFDAGTFMFDSVDVQALAAERAKGGKPPRNADGELAAAVFAMFDTDADLRDIVRTLKVPPQVVRTLYDEWRLPLEDGWREVRMAKTAETRRRASRYTRRDPRTRRRARGEAASVDANGSPAP